MGYPRTIAIALAAVISTTTTTTTVPYSLAQDLKSLDGHWECSTSHGGYYFKYTLEIRQAGAGKWRSKYTAGESDYPYSKPGTTSEGTIEADGPNRFKLSAYGRDDPHPARRGPWEALYSGKLDDSGLHWNVRWKTASGYVATWSEECVRALRSGQGTTRIARAQLAFKERVAKRKAELKNAAWDLGRRKEALEKAVLDASNRAERALQEEAELKPRLEALDRRERELLDFLQRLRKAEGESPKVRAIKQAIVSVATGINRLEDAILAGRKSGGDVSKFEAQLRQERRTLKTLEQEMNDQFRGSESGNRWLAELRKMQEAILSFREREAAITAELTRAEAELRAAIAERAEVDTKLFQLAERLAGFDPAVQAVTVEASGKKVFQAVAGVPFAQLLEMNARIAESQKNLTKLEQQKRAASDVFFGLTKEAIASQARLAKLLGNLAWARFGVDLGFDTIDVLQAMGKGGIVGGVAELAKKVPEKLLLPELKTPGVDPGSIEADINALYDAQLKDSWSQVSIARVAAERGVKDLALKRGKDRLNQGIGTLVFDKVEFPWREETVERAIQAARDPREFNRAIKQIEKLQKQVEGIRKGFKYELKDAGKSILKDGLKTIAKGLLDQAERDAWVDFLEKDILARMHFSSHQIASHYYWQAFDNHEALLHEKAKMLEGLDPETGLKTVLSEKFARKARLRITLNLVVHPSGRDDIQVFVGGIRANRMGSLQVYEVNVERANLAGDGTLPLELR